MTKPTYCRPLAFERFQSELLHVDSTDGLFRSAFAISLHERPEADLAEAQVTVERLTGAVHNRVQTKSGDALLAH